jgi:hypothetical protein
LFVLTALLARRSVVIGAMFLVKSERIVFFQIVKDLWLKTFSQGFTKQVFCMVIMFCLLSCGGKVMLEKVIILHNNTIYPSFPHGMDALYIRATLLSNWSGRTLAFLDWRKGGNVGILKHAGSFITPKQVSRNKRAKHESFKRNTVGWA